MLSIAEADPSTGNGFDCICQHVDEQKVVELGLQMYIRLKHRRLWFMAVSGHGITGAGKSGMVGSICSIDALNQCTDGQDTDT